MAFSDFSGILILQKYQYGMQLSESILAKMTINYWICPRSNYDISGWFKAKTELLGCLNNALLT